MLQNRIRNFSIIAHIDHGKSTLADRILELTNTVSGREMREQVLDSMELERERGITIKAQAVRVRWKEHELNLIDTPCHVDFTYEVSRSLQACEGALLVVDAAQGIEAQTLANAYLAIENDLEIVPVVNKIDLPQAETQGGEVVEVHNPAEMPREVERVEEPYVAASVIVPKSYVGAVMELCNDRRGRFDHMEYLSEERVLLSYDLPLGEIVLDYYDQLKSRTRGDASFDYDYVSFREGELARVDILIAGEPVDALSLIVH